MAGRPARWSRGRAGVLRARTDCELRAEFCAELGLADPGISWLTSRDRIAEFGALLAMVCGTLARIGNEVYELQRPEIGELREPTTADTVGSITMPHKRNPEGSEHLDTLARLARANAAVLTEGMVVGHERDGRGWKAEWVALPEVCLLTGVALQLARRLLSGLSVEVDTMRSNLHRHGDQLASEQILAGLSQKLGKHTAQRLMHEVLAPGSRDVHDVVGAVVASGAATAERLGRGRRGTWAMPAGWSTRSSPALGAPARPSRRRGCESSEDRPRRSSHAIGTRMHRLEAALQAGPLYLKRDDLTGFGVAGNKARALEFLIGAAVDEGADIFVAAGSPSSNFCAAAAMAAATVGLDCDLLFPGSRLQGSVGERRAGAGCRCPVALRRRRDPRRARRRRPRARECPAC